MHKKIAIFSATAHATYFLNYLAPRATGDTNWSQLLPIYQVSGDEALLFWRQRLCRDRVRTGNICDYLGKLCTRHASRRLLE